MAIPVRSKRARAQTDLGRVDAFYAVGAGWLAAPEQIDAVSGQQSIVQDVALALHGLVRQGDPAAAR